MSFPKYAMYKESDVEWLGHVPEHWVVKPIRLAAKLESGHTPSRSHLEYWEDCTVPWFTLADVWQIREAGANYIYETKEKVSAVGLANSSARLLPKDTVILSRTASVGFSAIMGVDMATTQDFANWICGKTLLPDFLLNVFRSMEGEFRRLMMGSTHNTIYMPDIQSLRFALPPLAEQRRIIDFLNGEVSEIDALLKEQRRLIELLKEKRQAVISHAVTKGLNPHAPMKPSGIEWLGDVPHHWESVALKHLAKSEFKTFTDGDWIESPFITDDGVRLIQTGNVGIGIYKEQGFRYVSEATFAELRCTEINARDVLICRLDGPVGRACLVPDLGVRMITSVDNTILKVADNVLADFVVALLSSVAWLSWIDALCRVGGGFRLRISRSMLGDLRVPKPPLSEQIAITNYLYGEMAKWDALTAEAQRAIDLLQERRTALISAAVTGKIDVRGLTESEAA